MESARPASSATVETYTTSRDAIDPPSVTSAKKISAFDAERLMQKFEQGSGTSASGRNLPSTSYAPASA
jgi:hypothetical protein